jgi:hypothetical protein
VTLRSRAVRRVGSAILRARSTCSVTSRSGGEVSREALAPAARAQALGGLPHRERQLVWPAERNAGENHARWPQLDPALALVVAGIDELDRTFNDLQQRHVAGRTDLERAELRQPVDRRIDGRHGDRLLERKAHVEKLARHPGEIRHAGRVAGDDVDVGGDRVESGTRRYRGLGHRVVEAAAVTDVENDAALLGGGRRRQQPAVLRGAWQRLTTFWPRVCRASGHSFANCMIA